MDDENSKFGTGDHGEDESIAGMQSGTVTANVKAVASSDPETEPKWWKAAKACGCGVVTYTGFGLGLVRRKLYDCTTYSVAVYDVEMGATPVTTIHKYAGCVGNMVLSADGLGAPQIAGFTYQGKLYDVVDGTALVLTSPDTTQAETFINSATTIFGSSAVQLSSYSFDLGNDINPVLDQSDSTGINKYSITASRPRLSVNPLALKQATATLGDWLANILGETSGGIVIPSANMSLDLLDAQMITHAQANREGYVGWDQTFKALRGGLTSGQYLAEDTWELLHGARA